MNRSVVLRQTAVRSRSLCVLLCAAVAAACSEGTGPKPPTVSGVSPTNGPLAGGTAVTITGSNFPTGVDSARVGTGRLGNLARVSATQLTGITPAGTAAGAVDVTVYTASAGHGSCTGCFTYNPATRVTWTRLAAGFTHTCGLASGGKAYCWGDNFFGQLGTDGTDVGHCRVSGELYPCSLVPVAVGGGLTFGSLTVGSSHTCGLTSVGAAYCWGSNQTGTLGTSVGQTCGFPGASSPCSTAPVAVAGGLVFVSVTAGGSHTCGLTSDGTAYCWGDSSHGQLGATAVDQCYVIHDYWTPCSRVPLPVAGGLTFASLTAGEYHTCGLTRIGAAYCWGNNDHGQLGDSTTTDRTAPAAVAGGLTFASLTAGGGYTCGLTSSGAAYCWGRNSEGELGDGSTTDRLTPAAVAGGLTFKSMTAGEDHTCGVTTGGAAYCWGSNYSGQLGDASTSNRTSPAAVLGGLVLQTISSGHGYHTCALAASGTAYCWGGNDYGQLGDGSFTDRSTPVPVVDQ